MKITKKFVEDLILQEIKKVIQENPMMGGAGGASTIVTDRLILAQAAEALKDTDLAEQLDALRNRLIDGGHI